MLYRVAKEREKREKDWLRRKWREKDFGILSKSSIEDEIVFNKNKEKKIVKEKNATRK